jgi:hypothetical protein
MSQSQVRPSACSSQESQVFHGVFPPEQFVCVPVRIEYASTTLPSLSKRIAPAPPWPGKGTSEFEVRIQPPSGCAYVACPSGCGCIE